MDDARLKHDMSETRSLTRSGLCKPAWHYQPNYVSIECRHR